jgi:hypothetical protein
VVGLSVGALATAGLLAVKLAWVAYTAELWIIPGAAPWYAFARSWL